MDILILGGPNFLGRAEIEAAIAAGHNVTVFNRGQTNPDLYPEIEKLRGDRDGALDALRGRRWDAVVDNSGFVPRIVRQSTELLADSVGHYVFVSSISAYRDLNVEAIDEDYPLAELEDPSTEEYDGPAYGGLKALCEKVVRDIFNDRALIVRPGLIVGPWDGTYRFPYWVTRTAHGGRMIAPARPEYQIQVIDARDLAAWMLRLAADGATGIYNATGPDYQLTLGAVLDSAKHISASDTEIVWAPSKFLISNGVTPWSDMPLWVPSSFKIHQVSVAKALAAGLTFRQLDETVRDTLAWAQQHPAPDPPAAGLTPEREAQLLKAWDESQPSLP